MNLGKSLKSILLPKTAQLIAEKNPSEIDRANFNNFLFGKICQWIPRSHYRQILGIARHYFAGASVKGGQGGQLPPPLFGSIEGAAGGGAAPHLPIITWQANPILSILCNLTKFDVFIKHSVTSLILVIKKIKLKKTADLFDGSNNLS